MTKLTSHLKRRGVIEVVAVLITGLLILAVVQLNRDSNAQATSAGASGDPTAVAETDEALPELPAKTIDLMTASGSEVKVLGDNEVDRALSSSEATAAAAKEFGVKAEPAAASLVSLTVTDYGKEMSDDASKSNLDLIIENRPTWVVLYTAQEFPVFGPYDPKAEEQDSETYTADMVVLVDAETGEGLRAETL